MMKLRFPVLFLLASVLTTGCSWFGRDDVEEIKPSPLPDFQREVSNAVKLHLLIVLSVEQSHRTFTAGFVERTDRKSTRLNSSHPK